MVPSSFSLTPAISTHPSPLPFIPLLCLPWSSLSPLTPVLPPSPLSSPLPPRLFLPPAACSSHCFIYLFPEAGSLLPLLVSAAAHSPGSALYPPRPLPSPKAWALPSASRSERKQTRPTGLPAFLEELSWQQECSCHLTPPGAGVGLSHPHTLRPPTPSGFPPSSHPCLFHPPAGLPAQCGGRGRNYYSPLRGSAPSTSGWPPGRRETLRGWFPNRAAVFTGSPRDIFTNTGSQAPPLRRHIELGSLNIRSRNQDFQKALQVTLFRQPSIHLRTLG